MWYISIKRNISLFLNIYHLHFCPRVCLCAAERNLFYGRFIRYYTYKSSSSSMPCCSAWYVLPVLEFLTDRRLNYISSVSLPLSPRLLQQLVVRVCMWGRVWERGREWEEPTTKCVCDFNSHRLPAHTWYPSSLLGQMAITFQLWKSSLYKHGQDWDALDQVLYPHW